MQCILQEQYLDIGGTQTNRAAPDKRFHLARRLRLSQLVSFSSLFVPCGVVLGCLFVVWLFFLFPLFVGVLLHFTASQSALYSAASHTFLVTCGDLAHYFSPSFMAGS